jgi:hypothetical protein
MATLTRIIIAVAVILTGMTVSSVWGSMSGTNYRICGWIGGSGMQGSISSNGLLASVGQPTSSRLSNTSAYGHRAGFVQPFTQTFDSANISPNSDSSIDMNTDFGCVRVGVPAGAFTSPVQLSVSVLDDFTEMSSPAGNLRGMDAGFEIAVTPSLDVHKNLTYGVCYQDQDVAGSDESTLRLAWMIPGQNQWVPIATTVDQAQNTAMAESKRLGTFRLVSVLPAAGLDSVRSYPNPFLPSQGHQNMTFANLPAEAEILIRTLSGEQVRNLRADSSGRASWDGMNAQGAKTGSGVYLVLLKKGSTSRVIRVGVER